MAIYIRSRPTTGTMVLGCLLTLIAVGIVLLLPAALFLAGYALASMEEAARYPSESSSVGNGAAQIVTVTTTYSFMLTAVTFGAVFCFKGTNRWLTKNSTVTHRDIASARFLHVAKDPNSRAAGMLWAMLAGMLLAASPVIVLAAPRPLIGSGLAQGLEDKTVLVVIVLVIVLFVALKRAAARRWASTVRMTARGMAVADPKSFSLPLPSSRNDLRIQEAPARLGRVTVQAVYAPPTGGAEPGRPIIIPRLSLTVRPSRLDDARSRVEARLDEVWRATQLIRTSIEQEETADAPPSEPELKQAHRPPHQDADPDHDQSQADNPLP
ncbi:hypothetical protein BKH20_06425 [Actinomyces oris]|uniref:Uncharacterized protein n=1 Tax=Actinomyces oris TaxID=544580 RepID=A0A1Q8WQ70_9ACTO|nr:hypothetical protein [Actinomyces oris]OLO70114.1 hypothetical protein BKH20_06425 [Actinomyces oris]